jgi:Bacterial Ig-like domain (group 3)
MKTLRAPLVLSLFVLLLTPGAASAAGTLDQQQANTTGVNLGLESVDAGGQTFTAGISGELNQVEIYVSQFSLTMAATLPLTVEITTVAGGKPSTTTLASSTVPSSSVSGGWVVFSFAVAPHITAGTQYAIVAYTADTTGYAWRSGGANLYANGAAWWSFTTKPPAASWEPFNGENDFAFKTYVTPVANPTSTSVKCEPPSVVAGQSTTCTATVTDTAPSGQTTPTGTVNFTTSGPGSFSKTSCTLSGSGASASCSVTYTPKSTPAEPVRTDTITATYEGDGTHEGSKGVTTVTVISPTALAHGSFVIGDKNAVVGTGVTFYDVEWWGSEWWKRNSLSGGRAPSAFKGFAETASSPPECNKEWTTNTGNSSGPPATVPEYMEVIGASKITRSGSTIKGNAPKLAVIKTNPGYLPDPGHKGTGKVVAVIECQ